MREAAHDWKKLVKELVAPARLRKSQHDDIREAIEEIQENAVTSARCSDDFLDVEVKEGQIILSRGDSKEAVEAEAETSGGVPIYNGYGATIPAYAAMEITSESGGIYTVTRPTADDIQSCFVLFNGAEALGVGSEDGYGIGFSAFSDIVEARLDGNPAVGDEIGTVADSFDLATGQSGFGVLDTTTGGARVLVLPFLGRVSEYGYAYAGGYNAGELSSYQYDTGLDVWSDMTDHPTPPRRDSYGFASSGTGYMAGGYTKGFIGPQTIGDLDSYSAVDDSWDSLTDMLSVDHGGQGAWVLGMGYAFAGTQDGDRCDAYDPDLDSWSNMTDIPAPLRRVPAACDLGDYGLVFGGSYVSGSLIYLKDVDAYDPDFDSWDERTDMPDPARQYARAVSLDGKAYLTGGEDAGVDPAIDDCDEYDPDLDSWDIKTDMPAGRYSHVMFASSLEVFAAGGYTGTAHDELYSFDPDSDSWDNKEDMPAAQYAQAGATLEL